MCGTSNEKFSKWNVWDLHVHPPGTALNDQYERTTLEDFCDELIELGMPVIGVTDYYSVKQAFAVKALMEQKGSGIRIFPNIEFRDPAKIGDRNMNYHVLFSDSVSKNKIDAFLARVPVEGASNKFLCDIAPKEADKTTTSLKGVVEKLRESFGQDEYFVILASGDDGYRPKGNHEKWAPRDKELSVNAVSLADAVFGNAKVKSFWDSAEARTIYGHRKLPVFACSDAHTLQRLRDFHSSDQRLWIKALPTFSGLCELRVEPSDRVRIQQFEPDAKDPAKVIETIELRSKSDNSNTPPKFQQRLELSPNLNSVIGARSSGKSLLGAALSYAVEPTMTISRKKELLPETLKKSEIGKLAGATNGWPWAEFDAEVEVKIHWANNEVSTPAAPSGHLTYLPQGYLNALVETEELDRLLNQTLVNKDPKLRAALETAELSLSAAKNTIQRATETILQEERALEKAKNELKELGTEDQLRKRLVKLKDQLAEASGERLSKETKDLISELEVAKRFQDVTARDNNSVERQLSFLVAAKPPRPSVSDEIEKFESETLDAAWDRVWERFVEDAREILSRYIEAEDYACDLTNRQVIAIEEKLRSTNDGTVPTISTEHTELENEIATLERQVGRAKELKNQLTKLKESIAASTKQLLSVRKETLENAYSLTRDYQEENHDQKNSIKVSFELGFDDQMLPQVDFVNKNRENNEWTWFVSDFMPDPNGSDPKTVEQNFSAVIESILRNDLSIRRGQERKRSDLLKEIALLLPRPRVFAEMEGDRIGGFRPSDMSAGKRAMVALTLLLEDSEQKWPLIIDQPEDDLDSRSITDVVVPFLRSIKADRQVIIISHNANLVVGSDSENVIVANQHSEEFKNRSKLRYYYGCGALESQVTGKKKNYFFARARIKDHVCQILDGGQQAFSKRAERYRDDNLHLG